MKIRKVSFCGLVLLTLSSCEFNKSARKDFITGAVSKGDGIGVDEVVVQSNGKEAKGNVFLFGEQINLLFQNVKGLKRIDNKNYPGMAIFVVKNERDTVLSNADILKDATDLNPLQLNTYFTAVMPHQHNEKYKVIVNIWDKKGDGKFYYELPFTVKGSDVHDIKSNGISYSTIYLWNETSNSVVFNDSIGIENDYMLFLEGVAGLETKNGKVFPVLSIDLRDANDHILISNPNLLETYATKGVDPHELRDQLRASFSFTQGDLVNPCTLTVILKDQLSSKEISVISKLTIQ
ncbi:hypothetical protein U1E44_06020 [Arenibacter sp. GZD96]|uniref:hypothetical protein n=1 Tax=Aurantibrevibacter litoralis TaxID=3106030 RepID=UPI002AFE7AD8|nr:hypothetical protein [Arenibacter sp. GZD-96]MEA1785637.1 hypothetical protein [Arenibacter sp. GZD-96]